MRRLPNGVQRLALLAVARSGDDGLGEGSASSVDEVRAAETEPAFSAYRVCDEPTCATATRQTLDDPALHVDLWHPASPPGLMMFTLKTGSEW